ncbi:MAG: ATP-binding protein, partial [Myxococcota bacterium]
SIISYTRGDAFSLEHTILLWLAVGGGFALTIVFARRLPHAQDLGRFAAVQTATDIALAALTVYISGGVESGFVTLYLIAVLGAATMGGPRHTWAAAVLALGLYLGGTLLETAGVLIPLTLDPYVAPAPRAIGLSMLRTAGGILGVAVLSSYLNRELSTSVSQLGKLRMLNENIVRSLSSGLLTVDMHARVLYFNPMARAILDLEDDDIGQPLEQLMPGCDLSVSGADNRQELVIHTRGGHAVRVGMSLAPLIDADDRRLGHVVNFQDLTRLHELSQQVRRNDRLAAVGGLAASVAHEIRNPLAAISGSAELLGTTELSDEDGKLLRIIRRESGRLSALITDLLSFTRPRPPQRRRTDIGIAVREATEAFRTDPSAAGIDLRVEAPEDEALVVVDSAQLAQVLWNLLRNASQALEGTGSIQLRVRAEAADVLVSIIDDGPGIPAADLERIFDPFFTTKESGTGFGLAIVNRIIDDNGGTITCTSSPEGTAFTLRFPRVDPTVRAEESGVLELVEADAGAVLRR